MFDFPKTIMEIEIFANTIYYCIIGTFDKVNEIKKIFDTQNNPNKKYIVSKLNYPIINLLNDDYSLNTYIEYAQCSLYAKYDSNNMYSLICEDTENNKLGYFMIDLKNEIDPEDMIINELKILKSLKLNKKNIKLIDIIGIKDDILLYSYFLGA